MLQSRYSGKEDHIFQILHALNIYFKIEDLKNVDIHCSPKSKWICWDGAVGVRWISPIQYPHPLAWIFKGGLRFACLKLVFSLSWVKIEPGHSLVLNTVTRSGVSLACMVQPLPSVTVAQTSLALTLNFEAWVKVSGLQDWLQKKKQTKQS